MTIWAKKFNAKFYPAKRDGTIGDLTETGFCTMDLTQINALLTGRGNPDYRVAVNAGIIGNFSYCRKISVNFERQAIGNDAGTVYRRDKYTIQYKIDGADFGNIMGS